MAYNERHRKKPLHKHARRIPLKDDEGIYFHCWWCGFINKEGRSEEGGKASPSGVDHLETISPSDRYSNHQSVLGGSISHFHVTVAADAAGDAKKVKHTFGSNIASGCPNCGSKNWRGQ